MCETMTRLRTLAGRMSLNRVRPWKRSCMVRLQIYIDFLTEKERWHGETFSFKAMNGLIINRPQVDSRVEMKWRCVWIGTQPKLDTEKAISARKFIRHEKPISHWCRFNILTYKLLQNMSVLGIRTVSHLKGAFLVSPRHENHGFKTNSVI